MLLTYLAIGMFQQLRAIPTFLPFSDMFFPLLVSCLFSYSLAYQTNDIVAGNHPRLRMNDQDYVYGAMSITVACGELLCLTIIVRTIFGAY
jgi:hypothetical protein